MITQTTLKVIGLVGLIALVSGCETTQQDTTPTVGPVITQEVVIPVAACPKEVNELTTPVRPKLPIDDLTEADRENYDKVGKAYIQTTEDLKMYAQQLESQLGGIKSMCKSVNTAQPGTKR